MKLTDFILFTGCLCLLTLFAKAKKYFQQDEPSFEKMALLPENKKAFTRK
jgi:hypothetical protein